jgi:cell wall-associated NlpC family hydrolase
MTLDPRLTPARADLAAASLRGRVTAARFVEGVEYQVSAGVAPLRGAPRGDAMQESQLLFGERFRVFEEKDGWAWGQAAQDSYVGFIDMEALSAPVITPTHRVCALRTYVFSEPSIKSAPHFLLSLNAEVTVEADDGKLAKIARSGFVPSIHLRPIGQFAPDWVAEAERFLHAPYQWGGKESLGLDCSGLVQSAMIAAGLTCPRDSDMQEAALGETIPIDPTHLKRGDLVFWKGHVGLMLDSQNILHANAFHMATAIEPLAETTARLTPLVGPVRAIKRLPDHHSA